MVVRAAGNKNNTVQFVYKTLGNFQFMDISTQNVESAAAAPTPTNMSHFYLIPKSDFFVCEIWICSLFYYYM